MTSDNFDVIAVGNAKIDTFLTLNQANKHLRFAAETNELCIKFGEKISVDEAQVFLGGNAANVSVGLSRLGLKVALIAEIGKDEFAQKIINTLASENVDTSNILQTQQQQSSFSIIISFKKERTIFSKHTKREHNFSFENISAKWIYLTSIGDVWEKAYKRIADLVRNKKIRLAFNPGTLQIASGAKNLADVLSLTDILILNKEEGQLLLNDTNQNIKALLLNLQKLGPKAVVITDGDNGSYAIDDKGQIAIKEAIATNVIEKTGAGDAYSSGFLTGFIKTNNLQKAMHLGALNSSSCIKMPGAQNGLLYERDVYKNQNNLGYKKNLFILPFDHSSSFARMLGFTKLTTEEKNYIISAKKLIYEAFKKAVLQSVPKDQAAVLVDEEYADAVLKDALAQGFTTILTTEKSGQEAFVFEYGEKFAEHIEKYKPTFVKALIRYKQNANWTDLKVLSDYCHTYNYKFLLEMLMGLNAPGSQDFLPAINELRKEGIEPDVWKLEGMENKKDYESVIAKIREGERENVGLVILGRGENREKVERWIKIASKVTGITGFAVGRTVFWDPLTEYKNGKITKKEAVEKISNNFLHFYNIFTGK